MASLEQSTWDEEEGSSRLLVRMKACNFFVSEREFEAEYLRRRDSHCAVVVLTSLFPPLFIAPIHQFHFFGPLERASPVSAFREAWDYIFLLDENTPKKY